MEAVVDCDRTRNAERNVRAPARKGDPMFSRYWRGAIVLAGVVLGQPATAQTTVCGNQSGTWSLAGSPYYVACDVNVPNGQVLTIEPGVVVEFFSGTSINVNGQLLAEGTREAPIVFDELVSGQPWNRIYVYANGGAPPTSRFEFCRFRNAQTAIYAYVYGQINGTTRMAIELSYCTFDSIGTAIFCRTRAQTPGARFHAKLDPVIEGCRFDAVGDAIYLYMQGFCGGIYCAGGYSDTVVDSNLFDGVDTAFRITQINPAGGTVVFCNNSVINSTNGVMVTSGFPSDIANNVFYGTTNAVTLSGTHTVGYNSFYANTTLCSGSGCPVSLGVPVITNANGDPCDLFYNLTSDPQLFAPLMGDARPMPNSPCVNAGDNAALPSSSTSDILGLPRVYDGVVDIGAYELLRHLRDARGGPISEAPPILR